MSFQEGQQVRVKDKKTVGRVARKLISLDDVYVVVFDAKPSAEERLVRGADLEPLPDADNQQIA
jgi:hypothetical protein